MKFVKTTTCILLVLTGCSHIDRTRRFETPADVHSTECVSPVQDGENQGAIAAEPGADRPEPEKQVTAKTGYDHESDAASRNNCTEETLFRLRIPETAHVRNCKNYYLNRYRSDYMEGLERRKRYIGMIQEKIRERGMPEAVKWIPMVESWFTNTARSPARAVGLWQLMPATAKAFGLRIDEWVDERKDPERSTVAALDYLDYLYQRTGCWFLTFAAYHSGEGSIYRAIRNNGSDDYWHMAENREFSSYTRFYVAAIMALALIERNHEQFHVEFPELETPDTTAVHLDRQLDLRILAQKTGIDLEELRRLNPSLKRNVTPPDYPGFALRIPSCYQEKTRAVLATAESGWQLPRFEYVIQPGDTLSSIAGRFKTSVERLMKMNNLLNHRIIAGKKLLIPDS